MKSTVDCLDIQALVSILILPARVLGAPSTLHNCKLDQYFTAYPVYFLRIQYLRSVTLFSWACNMASGYGLPHVDIYMQRVTTAATVQEHELFER